MKSFVSLLFAPLLCACRSAETRSPNPANPPETFSTLEERMVLKLGFYSPSVAHASYQPIVDYLTSRTPYRFDLRLARTPDDAMAFLEERIAEVVELDPLSYIDVHEKFGAVPLVRPLNDAGEPLVRCVFVAHLKGGLARIADLEGKRLGLGPPDSVVTNLLPRHELSRAGVSLEGDTVETFSDEETMIASIVAGRLDAGALTEAAAARNKEKLQVLHVSAPLPTGPLAVRADLPDAVAQAVARAFLSLRFSDATRRAAWNPVARYGFAPACDADYDGVRRILSRVRKDPRDD